MKSDTGQLAGLFNAARQLTSEADVSAFIARHCVNAPELRERLEVLLREHRRGSPTRAGAREAPGSVIGRYRLVETLGEGGFGVVWLAEQHEPIQREVALKILKLGMDTGQVVERFEHERQALALMDHPNIARVLDAGATDAGRPYFVMELVRGVPLLDYCDEHRLDAKSRLRLFVDTCRAIQHAHQKGIVHRDIKPSNVLVALADGVAIPKVIDFGVAKAIDGGLAHREGLTEQRQLIGTPAYMAPEQAEMTNASVDTRSDVYSLGVLLYELLTGSTPFDVVELLERGLSEMLRAIREVEPHRPSTRIATLGNAADAIAVRRRTDARKLHSQLSGELDWIVMHAIEKAPERRYESAGALADDVERYLVGAPVLAAPPSRVYRIAKFARRNKLAAGAGLLVVGSLALGAVGFGWQARVAAAERDSARAAAAAEAEQRALAELNAKKADAVSSFLASVLRSANARQMGRNARVVDALDAASARVGATFADSPEVEASLRQTLGDTYVSISVLGEAEPHLLRAEQLLADSGRTESLEYAQVLSSLGTVASVKGDSERALDCYQRALEIALRLEGPGSSVALAAQTAAANRLVDLGRIDEAEGMLREALRLDAEQQRLTPRDRHVQINSLAVLLHKSGRLEEAERHYRAALEIGESELGDKDIDTLTARINLGSLLDSRGLFADAEPLLRSAHAGLIETLGPAHLRAAEASTVLATFLNKRGKLAEARTLLETAVVDLERISGAGHESVLGHKRALADLLRRVGDAAGAVKQAQELFDVLSTSRAPGDRLLVETQLGLATALATADRLEESDARFSELLEEYPKLFGEEHPNTLRALSGYSFLLMRRRHFEQAAEILQRALEVGRRVDGARHHNTVINEFNLSACLRECGRLEEAERVGRAAVELARDVFGPEHANIATMRAGLAETLVKLQRPDEALDELREALRVANDSLGATNATSAGFAVSLARLLLGRRELVEARALLEPALEVLETRHGSDERRTSNARAELARCEGLEGRFEPAAIALEAAHSALAKSASGAEADCSRAAGYLRELFEAWNARDPSAERAERAKHWRALEGASN